MSDERIYAKPWNDYELIDAGGGKKLERWGSVITIRPEVQAYFKTEKSFKEWEQIADWEFVARGSHSGSWKPLKSSLKKDWQISF